MGHKHTKISREPEAEPDLAVRPLAPFQEFQQVTAPLDDEGFVQSFAVVDGACGTHTLTLSAESMIARELICCTL